MNKQTRAEHSRSIKLHNKKINYILKTSKRAKRMRLAVYCDGSFVVTRPRGMSDELLEKFITQKANWVLSKLDYFKQFKGRYFFGSNKKNYLKYKEDARCLIQERLEYYNRIYKLKYNKINVKNQKTRWGSCSKKGNLNFNYKILFLPKNIADYIIVHELCHLKEFNHSRRFWNLVAKTMPNYLDIKKKLKSQGIRYY